MSNTVTVAAKTGYARTGTIATKTGYARTGAIRAVEYATYPQYLTDVGGVMLTFDDQERSIYTNCYSYMLTKRARGTFYARTGLVGQDNSYMSWAILREMEAGGWCIGNHTRLHTDYPEQADIANGSADLIANGISAESAYHFSYPNGHYNDTVVLAAQAAGQLTGRTIDGGKYVTPAAGYDLYRIPFSRNVVSTTTLAQIYVYVDYALANHRIACFLSHGIPGDMTISDFQTLIDYCISKRLPFFTMADIYASMTGPVTVPIGA